MQTDTIAITSYFSTSSQKDLKFQINKFIDYAATHPTVKIRYHANHMHLCIYSDAYYLNESKNSSRNGGLLSLSEKPKLPSNTNDTPPKLNAPVLVNSKTINTVISSV